ncbi:MAG TPA: ABC transporter substrate-binding protein [Dehalococcoidia bacterium]|nr:ABC transporter substrate-binding protein [Dehalococcoidia bacterium]
MRKGLVILLVTLLAMGVFGAGCAREVTQTVTETTTKTVGAEVTATVTQTATETTTTTQTITATKTTTATKTVTAAPPKKEKIVITEVNWGSAAYQAYIMAFIIEHGYGYPVEVIGGTTIAMFEGIMMGEVDIFPEAWLPNMQAAWDKGLAEDAFIPVALTNNDNWQSTFVVPTYVIKGDPARGIEPMAPDLKSVFDLKDPKYVKLFEDPEDPGKGRILICVPGWECEKIGLKQIEAYGLADLYNPLPAGSSAALFASLKGAYDKGEPWLGYMWGPTYISGMLDLTLLEEPPYSPEAFAKGECGFPSADLWIGTSKNLAEKAPEIFPFLVQWRMPTADMAEGLAYMAENEIEADEAAIWFLKTREDMWTKWVPDDVEAKVKAALAKF